MFKKFYLIVALAVSASLLMTSVAFAGELPPPVQKSLLADPSRKDTAWMAPPEAAVEAGADLAAQTEAGAAFGGPVPAGGYWYLMNGAFDDNWDGNAPLFWKVHPGDADSYGSFEFDNRDSGGMTVDRGFAFTIINNEVKSDHNAYVYQEISLPTGQYWVEAHSSIYAADSVTAVDPSHVQDAYSYMTYYALVPKAMVMGTAGFDPAAIDAASWKELWMRPETCSEAIKGGVFWPNACLYQKRAETVSVSGGEYVFVLRAELKFNDWRAHATYAFDDIQIIAADPSKAEWNACEDTFCKDGWLWR
jgi:hypothetical protein